MPNSESSLPQAKAIVAVQVEAVDRWHVQPLDTAIEGLRPLQGLWDIICQQHQANFRLWHQEDIARSPSASDREIAQVKRSIDRLNQQRNDLIERIDDAIGEHLLAVTVSPDATQNTETVGSVIDRLSIIALRLFHYREQADRRDVDAAFRESVGQRIEICQRQQADLTESLQQLLDDLLAGRKRHQTYRQLKMYNDPTLNPAIYNRKME